MRDIAVEVGTQIRAIRKSKNIAQEKLANLASIDRSYMGRIERGEVNITLNMLYEISLVLETDMRLLIPEEPKK